MVAGYGVTELSSCIMFAWFLCLNLLLCFSDIKPRTCKGRKNKFPVITPDYMSVSAPNMYFAGGLTHSLDFRKSSGGFIHGFRYMSKC